MHARRSCLRAPLFASGRAAGAAQPAHAAPAHTRAQVEAALTHLQNEAHAFTTVDDDHWKAVA